MRLNVGVKIGGGYALALLILLIIGIITYRGTVAITDSYKWIDHANAILTEISETLSLIQDASDSHRGYIITGGQQYLEPYNAALLKIENQFDNLESMINDKDQHRKLNEFKPLVRARLDIIAKQIIIRRNNGFDAALKEILTDKGKKMMDEIRKVAKEMMETEYELLNQWTEETFAVSGNTKSTIIYGTILAFVVLFLTAFLITRNIARPLREISELTVKVGSGDLTINLPSNSRKDEVGILNNAFSTMVENLRKQTREILEGVDILSTQSAEINAAVAQIASNVSQTSASVNETTTTVEEVKQTTQVANERAKTVSESAQKNAEVAKNGENVVEETSKGMIRIREQMESITDGIIKLSEQSQAISDIIASVDDIAEQSNLLAVNASIEAAKAGEQGKGFSVVAQEIKTLAEQSKQSTEQVRKILNEIQKATSAAVMSTEQGSKVVEAGVEQSAQAGEAIQVLASSINESAKVAIQIAASSQQQFAGIEQVTRAMENINQSAIQNEQGTKQLEVAVKDLKDLGQNMKKIAAQYKV